MCELCRNYPCIDQRCPNYTPRKITHYCSFCGDEIYEGEEYIENLIGEYRHHECFHGVKDLLEWLGFDVKTMETEYE